MINEIKILICEFCGKIDANSRIGKIHEELGYCPYGEGKNIMEFKSFMGD